MAQQAAANGIDTSVDGWWQDNARSPPPFDAVFVPVGGGGLIAGVGSYIKAVWGAQIEVVGCQPASNAAMLRCLQAGRVLDDGYTGNSEEDDGHADALREAGVSLAEALPPVEEWAVLHPSPESKTTRAVGCLKCPTGRADGRDASRWVSPTWLNLPTLSDGTAGGVEEGSVTLGMCAAVVDSWECVAEDAIREAQA